MNLWFGNPKAVDLGKDLRTRYRTKELVRLRAKYGAFEVDAAWEQNKPRVECFELTGERIITVVDDPEGREVTPAQTSVARAELLEEQLARLENEMKVLRAEQRAQGREDDALDRSDAQADGPSGTSAAVSSSRASRDDTIPPSGERAAPAAGQRAAKDAPNRAPVRG